MASVAPLTRPSSVASREASPSRRSLRWVIAAQCPPGWWALLERSDGGVFHSPAGLGVAAPAGASVFAELHDGEQAVGLAAGVALRCRIGFGRRHFYFPTVPTVVDPSRTRDALRSLMETLRALGAAQVQVDSFDAPWRPEPGDATIVTERLEYVVRLTRSEEEMAGGFSKHHRRHVQRGDRDGWMLRELESEEARTLLSAVQREASARAAGRGDPFAASHPNVRSIPPGGGAPWGVTTFSAWHGDVPLAAALVGWANRRAFYLIGGSTPAGYECDAAQWMHWRIMCALRAHGYTQYNLGGTPASASQAGDPAHGLYRFKTGFGPDVVSCRSTGWTLSEGHARAHRMVRRVADYLRR